MFRVSLLLASLVLASCASVPANQLLVSKTLEPRTGGGVGEEHAPAPVTEASEVTVPSVTTAGSEELRVGVAEPAVYREPSPSPFFPLAADEGLRESRTTLKAGYYSAEDADELDDGWIANISWMRFFSNWLALELEAGYFDADGDDGGVDGEVWGIPVMVNGRANIPLWVLDVYGGAGVGTIYYDAEASGAVSAEDDGFLLGGNAFVGATINVADAIALGLEAKYYLTEEADDIDAALDAYALMLTLGFSR